MVLSEKINAIRSMIGGSETDQEITIYLNLARDKIIKKRDPYNRLNLTEVPTEYEQIQIDLTVYLIAKRGAEGEVTHIENNVSRTYKSEGSILKQIVPLCGIL